MSHLSKPVDSLSIINNALRVKNAADSLIKNDYEKTKGYNACGITESFEVFMDSNSCNLLRIGYYHPKGIEETQIAEYFSNDTVVFVNVQYRNNMLEEPLFERQIFIDDTIRIKKPVVGDTTQLPAHVKAILKPYL